MAALGHHIMKGLEIEINIMRSTHCVARRAPRTTPLADQEIQSHTVTFQIIVQFGIKVYVEILYEN